MEIAYFLSKKRKDKKETINFLLNFHTIRLLLLIIQTYTTDNQHNYLISFKAHFCSGRTKRGVISGLTAAFRCKKNADRNRFCPHSYFFSCYY